MEGLSEIQHLFSSKKGPLVAIVRENTAIEFLNLETLEIEQKSISVFFSPNNKLCFMDDLDEIIVYGSDHSMRIFGISDK